MIFLKNYLVIKERNNGLTKIRIKPWIGENDYYLPFDSETYTAYTTSNVDFDTDILRYGYQSLTTPSSVIDFDMKTKTKTVLKEQEVLGGDFDKNTYKEENLGNCNRRNKNSNFNCIQKWNDTKW